MLKQSGWTGFPSGREKGVMELAVPRSEIESRYGLVFIQGEDSLGPVHSTYFIDDLLGPVTIHYYERTSHGIGYVFVDDSLTFKVAVPRLLEVLGLDRSLVHTPVDLDQADEAAERWKQSLGWQE
jgi:hypothetical protein